MRTRAQQGGEWHDSDDLLVPDSCKEATKLLDAVVITPVVTVMAFQPLIRQELLPRFGEE